MTNQLPDKIQKLIGIQITDGAKDYGTVIDAEGHIDNNHLYWELITDTGFRVSANQLIALLAEIDALSSEVVSENHGQYLKLPPSLPAPVNKFSWGGAKAYASASIDNIAKINGESINIAKRPG